MQQYTTLIFIALLALAFYFLILRPQRKRQQAVQKTMNALSPGDRVMLASGLFGTVVSVGAEAGRARNIARLRAHSAQTGDQQDRHEADDRQCGRARGAGRGGAVDSGRWRTRSQRETPRSRRMLRRRAAPIEDPPVAAAPGAHAVEPGLRRAKIGIDSRLEAFDRRLSFLN